jgi:hypothetical protein
MRRLLALPLIAAGSLALGGCVAAMAASAVGMAVKGAQGTPQSNAQLKPEAEAACAARASQYGTVHVIDVEQHSASRIIVWGTVDDGKQRRSFQCDFGTAISGFTLRPIAPR